MSTHLIDTESRTLEGNDWTPAGPYFTACFHMMNPANVKGCPMGRSHTSEADAIADLCRRTNDESSTSIAPDQCEIKRRNGQTVEAAPAADTMQTGIDNLNTHPADATPDAAPIINAASALVWIVTTPSAYRAAHACLLGSGPTKAAALEEAYGPRADWSASTKRAASRADVHQVTADELAELEESR